MPDILGYWDRWADTWYYPTAYSDLSPLEKWAGREPTLADRKKYAELLRKKSKARKNAEIKKEKEAKCLDKIVFVSWEESEQDRGQRPDGCSLHLTKKDYYKFLKVYWARMPKEVPDEYSEPAGKPEEAFASPRLYDRIKSAKKEYSLRLWRHEQIKIQTKSYIKYGKNRSGWVPIE